MRILDPREVEPTINPASPEHVSGRQMHRRILSVLTGGPSSIDVGYNSFKAGIEITEPYAYSRDEFCYLAAGEMELLNDGVPVSVVGGSFMYRPTRAATHGVRVLKDTVSICAFSPARVDGWSHRLPPEEVGRWNGDEKDRPKAQIIRVGERRQGDHPWSKADGRIDYRKIVSTPGFELSSAAVSANTRFARERRERDEVWYLAAGDISIVQSGDNHLATRGQFLVWNPDDMEADLLTNEDSVLIIFSAKV